MVDSLICNKDYVLPQLKIIITIAISYHNLNILNYLFLYLKQEISLNLSDDNRDDNNSNNRQQHHHNAAHFLTNNIITFWLFLCSSFPLSNFPSPLSIWSLAPSIAISIVVNF